MLGDVDIKLAQEIGEAGKVMPLRMNSRTSGRRIRAIGVCSLSAPGGGWFGGSSIPSAYGGNPRGIQSHKTLDVGKIPTYLLCVKLSHG